jgi:hypothetical protein
MNRLPCRPVYAQVALVGVLGLVGLSLLVDAPAAAAAPNLAGGLVVLGVTALIARAEPVTRPRTSALLVLFGVGGLGLWYVGLADLGLLRRVVSLELVTDVALLLGLGLFVLDSGPESQ